MTVRQDDGSTKRLRLEQAEVSVRFLGDVAETVLDLRFRNDGDRAVEGEFVLPLPAGATVSGYALEVNDKLRDGVAVEKERARIAYESVKRRMIDPGIVERESGNSYRTKVYPVPAKGTKRLRISYNETLPANTRGFTYSLPVDFPESLDSFSCQLRGAPAGAIRMVENVGLDFATSDAGELKADAQKTRLAGILKLVLTPPAGPQMILEDEPQPAFYLTDTVPDIAPRPRPAPGSVLLVWDASESGLDRDHAKEISLLDSWFAKLGKTRVHLRLLRDRLEDGGEFEVRGGRWPKLKQALQQVDYDGATALSSLQIHAGQADLVVYVGDGVATLDFDSPAVAAPLVFLHSGAPATAKSLARLARSSGGGVIELATDSQQAALAKLTQQSLRLLSLQGDNLTSFVFDQDVQPGQRLRLFGTLRERRSGQLELRYGIGNEPVTTRGIPYQPEGHFSGIVGRLHAQRVLADLEQQDHPDRERIIEHCKRYGLVSDFTSLIVLDRIEDYIQYGIRPPEQDLQPDYDIGVAQSNKQRAADLGGLAWAWPVRLHWFAQRFPDREALLLPRMRQVGIWKKAVESQFALAQRDPEAFATVAGWFEKASGLIQKKPALRSKEDYEAWLKTVDELHAQGPKLAATPLHLPPAGQPLTVSVRGLVAKPGLVTGESGMTLRQVIDQAGGLNPLGSLDNIALYRNAGKIVYNTLSNQYQDVKLFPGDMVVVGQPGESDYQPSDPFAEPSGGPRPDPGKAAPIRQQGDLWTPEAANPEPFVPFHESAGIGGMGRANLAGPANFAAFPMTPATPSSFARPPRPLTPPPRPDRLATPAGDAPQIPRQIERAAKPTTALRPVERTAADPPDMTTFAKAIAAGQEPLAAYRSLKGKHVYPPKFYLEAARILYAKQHTALAHRVLSNLLESRPGDLATLRAFAYWLDEFGQTADADAVLRAVPVGDSADLQVLLDRASIQSTGGKLAAAADTLSDFLGKLESCQSGNLAAIALTDFNGIDQSIGKPGRPHPLAKEKTYFRQNLAADIRIVVTSTGGDDPLQLDVREPGGLACPPNESPSLHGGRITDSGAVREYMIRHAVPGIYQISCFSHKPTTVRAVIHTHWGRPNHTGKVVTLWLDGNQTHPVGEVAFEFQAPE